MAVCTTSGLPSMTGVDGPREPSGDLGHLTQGRGGSRGEGEQALRLRRAHGCGVGLRDPSVLVPALHRLSFRRPHGRHVCAPPGGRSIFPHNAPPKTGGMPSRDLRGQLREGFGAAPTPDAGPAGRPVAIRGLASGPLRARRHRPARAAGSGCDDLPPLSTTALTCRNIAVVGEKSGKRAVVAGNGGVKWGKREGRGVLDRVGRGGGRDVSRDAQPPTRRQGPALPAREVPRPDVRRPRRDPGPGALPLRLPDGRVPQGDPADAAAPTTSKAVRDYPCLPVRRLRRGARQAGPGDHPGRRCAPTPA